MKNELKIFYTGDKITAIGVDIDGRLEPILIVNPLCKVEAYERNKTLIDMVNAYNGKLLVELTKREPKAQVQVMPNFDDAPLKSTHSDRSFSIGVPNNLFPKPEPIKLSKPVRGIAVDCGSVNGKNPGLFEYRLVDIETGKVIINVTIPGTSSNNLAEYYAISHGIAYCIDNNLLLDVYSDSLTAMRWYKSGQCRTQLAVTDATQLNWIKDAIKLSKMKPAIKVLFWNNKTFGETPADYSRKKGKRK